MEAAGPDVLLEILARSRLRAWRAAASAPELYRDLEGSGGDGGDVYGRGLAAVALRCAGLRRLRLRDVGVQRYCRPNWRDLLLTTTINGAATAAAAAAATPTLTTALSAANAHSGLAAALAASQGGLRELQLSFFGALPAMGTLLSLVASLCPHLAVLDLRAASFVITQPALLDLFSACAEIKGFACVARGGGRPMHVPGDVALAAMAACWPRLHSLDLNFHEATAGGLAALAASCAVLHRLGALRCCRHRRFALPSAGRMAFHGTIPRAAELRRLARACPALSRVELQPDPADGRALKLARVAMLLPVSHPTEFGHLDIAVAALPAAGRRVLLLTSGPAATPLPLMPINPQQRALTSALLQT
eukprot:SM000017S02918  [mRNA]  locus=s17:1186073:1187902:+ [translate_table: standard]